MGTWQRTVGLWTLGAAVAVAACLPGRGPALDPVVEDGGPPPPTSLGDDSSIRDEVNLGGAFAVTGLQPAHGPWTGGTRTTIAGRGFSSSIEVWFGSTPLPASNVFASDPTRASVLTPAGAPGPVDVRVRNLSTATDAVLPSAFVYDSFSVTPGTGSTTGGTRIALLGQATAWTAASTVNVGGLPCTAVAVTDATHLTCTTPANGAGSQSVLVTNADGSTDEADDAFVYSDSPDGYRGGLYGGALAGTLNVLAFDSWTGAPITGAQAIAGSSLATAIVGTIGSSGAVQLTSPALTGKVTVTVAAKCHQPMTYVDVPVDTVTIYLPPILKVECGQGDPPSSGNYVPQDLGEIDGELVWTGGIEFQKAPWANVPQPGPGQRQAAYVFTASGSPASASGLPAPTTATTPTSSGQLGYAYTLGTTPGNQTLYALAGLETDTQSGQVVQFEPYAMGIVRGVPVQPSVKTAGVDIPMTTLLNHTVTTVPQPPAPTSRGPDRLFSFLAIDLGANLFATLPQGEIITLLPVPGDVDFAGAPTLDGTLAGTQYALAAEAVTGPYGSQPASVVSRIETTDTSDPVTIGGFLGIPVLTQPGPGTWNGTQMTIAATGPVDLAVVDVTSGGGLVTWEIVAPGTDLSFGLPDLSQVQGVDGLVHGTITTSFSVARVDGFQYSSLPTGQLGSSSWSAYAEDTALGSY